VFAGLPSGIPGIGDEIDGATQHAPQPTRHTFMSIDIVRSSFCFIQSLRCIFWKTRSMAQPLVKSANQTDYKYSGKFDTEVFKSEFTKQFQKNGRYNAAAISDTLVLLGMIENDPNITDVRWTAYMLATAFW
jgi:hypothetical protein